jgi:hypothetical protein
LLALILFVALIANARNDSIHSNVPDRDRVSLAEWAKENGFKLTWLKRDASLTLTNIAARLSFDVDSLIANINGVNVWLCEPITLRACLKMA